MDDGNGMQPTNGTHAPSVTRLRTSDGAAIVDVTSFPTVMDVARKAGVSHQAVRKWQRLGKLTPIEDAEGTTRFYPEEVDMFLAARHSLAELGDLPAETKVDPLVQSLFQRPRERIDDLLFRIVDRLMAQCEKQNEILERTWQAREQNQAQQAEQKLVAETLAEETKLKAGLVQNLNNAVGAIVPRVLARKDAGKPSLDFLEELPLETLQTMLLLDIYNAEAQAKIFRVVQLKQRQKQSTGQTTPAAETSTAENATKEAATPPQNDAGSAPQKEK